MLSKLKGLVPVAILLVISIVVCLANFTQGTYLSGWDTLHPEFNFGLAFERAIYGAFRVEQGLGAVAGHSHMADLPRIFILYLSHFVMPLSFLRYFYVFLCMVLGTIGMYFFLEKHLVKNRNAGFLGALFYLLNIGTLQTFNVPFEMFTTLFATLPFMFYFGTSYILENHNRSRNLLFFAIITVLNAPSAYAATLWYVFFACFIIYFLSLAFVDKQKDKHYFKHFGILTSVFVALNLFWLIPNLYFIANHGAEVAKANINRLFSDQAFLKNKEFGNIKDLLLLKSFYFDWSIYGGNGHFTELLAPWINHLKDVRVIFVGYLFGFGYILGAIYSYIKLGRKSLPIFAVLIFSLLFLINNNFPFAPIYTFFQNHVPFFKEALRFPDDKILNIYVFVISIFFSFFTLFIIEKLRKFEKHFRYELVFLVVAMLLVIFYSLPAFKGNFINSLMRINIPNSYFSLFKYLESQPQQRVANLPIQSPWGWVYYDFGGSKPSFQGAGFLYFGINGPLLDRDFDRWSPYNESYYREMSYAIYSQNPTLLSNVLKKYKIGIVFIDKSVIDPQNPKSVLFFDQSKEVLKKTGLVKDEKFFGQIDAFTLNTNLEQITSIDSNLNVFPTTTTTYQDFAYNSYGDYVSKDNSQMNIFYPFRDLIDNQSKLHNGLLKIDQDKITFIPSQKINNLPTNSLSKTTTLIPSDLIVKKDKNSITASIYPNTLVFDQTPSTSSIKSVINSNSTNLLLSFNGREFFNLSGVRENTPVALGKVFLKNGENTLSAFDTKELTSTSNVLASLNPFFSSCEGQGSPVTFLSSNSIKIRGKGSICMLIPYSFIKSTDKSLLTKLSFNLKTNAKVSSCLLNIKSQTCDYYADTTQTGANFSFNYVFLPGDVKNSAVEVFIKPTNNSENTYNITDVAFSYANSLADVIFSKSDIEKIFNSRGNISFDKIYLSKNVIYDPGFNITEVKNFQNNCPNSSIASKEIVSFDGQKAIKYSSDKGSYCDYFSYPNLPHNQGYLIAIYSKNIKGLPISVCVSNNQSGKCDIYSDLSSFKSFDKDVFLLPPMGEGAGYNINLENIGINKSPSQNYISRIEFIPIPYEFLLNINSAGSVTSGYNGKVVSVRKINPLLYIAKTDGLQTILSLNLSFEKGFRVYNIGCTNGLFCTFKAILAPIFEREVGEHVLIDNWANGWVLNSKENQVAIIFVPEYFEFLGFLVIVFVFLVLTLHHKNK